MNKQTNKQINKTKTKLWPEEGFPNFFASRNRYVIILWQYIPVRGLDLFTLNSNEGGFVRMTDQKAENISSIPIDAFSNLRITSIWTFLMSVSERHGSFHRLRC